MASSGLLKVTVHWLKGATFAAPPGPRAVGTALTTVTGVVLALLPRNS